MTSHDKSAVFMVIKVTILTRHDKSAVFMSGNIRHYIDQS